MPKNKAKKDSRRNRTTIRLPDALHYRLKLKAFVADRTMQDLVEEACQGIVALTAEEAKRLSEGTPRRSENVTRESLAEEAAEIEKISGEVTPKIVPKTKQSRKAE